MPSAPAWQGALPGRGVGWRAAERRLAGAAGARCHGAAQPEAVGCAAAPRGVVCLCCKQQQVWREGPLHSRTVGGCARGTGQSPSCVSAWCCCCCMCGGGRQLLVSCNGTCRAQLGGLAMHRSHTSHGHSMKGLESVRGLEGLTTCRTQECHETVRPSQQQLLLRC